MDLSSSSYSSKLSEDLQQAKNEADAAAAASSSSSSSGAQSSSSASRPSSSPCSSSSSSSSSGGAGGFIWKPVSEGDGNRSYCCPPSTVESRKVPVSSVTVQRLLPADSPAKGTTVAARIIALAVPAPPTLRASCSKLRPPRVPKLGASPTVPSARRTKRKTFVHSLNGIPRDAVFFC